MKGGEFRKKVHYFFDQEGQHPKNPNFFFKNYTIIRKKNFIFALDKTQLSPFPVVKRHRHSAISPWTTPYGSAQMIFEILQNPDTPTGSIGISAKSENSKFSNERERFI